MRRRWLASPLALLLAAPAAPARADVDLFPRPNEIFTRLLADPRHVQLSASYYRLDGRDTSDVALGHSWGLTRWRTGLLQDWLWEADVEGMAYSRFKIAGGINEYETSDFYANLPLSVRKGDVSFKGTLFHQSSHLGDDYIRRTGSSGFRYSVEGLRLQGALDPCRWSRVYGGAEYLVHTIPSPDRWSLQAGGELISPDLRLSWKAPTRLFLAQDVQWRQRVGWNADYRAVAGVKVAIRESPTRSMRLQVGYFNGHSPYGQFYWHRTHYADVAVVFEL